MLKNFIFDLDQTLVDTTPLETFRRARDWKTAYANIGKCQLYDGIQEVFTFIRKHAIKVCIVSSSPRPYIEHIVKYFNIPAEYIVAYHDTKNKKPSPEPMIKALSLLNCTPKEVISFGDRDIDLFSSKAANIITVACTWGAKHPLSNLQPSYDYIINSPLEIINLL